MGLDFLRRHGAVRAGKHKDLRSLSDDRLIEYWMRLLHWRMEADQRGEKLDAQLLREIEEYGAEFARRFRMKRQQAVTA